MAALDDHVAIVAEVVLAGPGTGWPIL